MGIDYDHLRDILATAIRSACPDPDDCDADEDECFQHHPIHAVVTTGHVVTRIEADLDGLVDLIIATLREEAFAFRPLTADSDWRPWRTP